MKRIHLLPNVITAFGLSCGLFVIFKMSMLPVGGATFQILTATTGILLLAALADLLDGAVARAMKAESDFGGLFDSMTDGIAFGVGPSVIVLKSIFLPAGSQLSFVLTSAAMVFSVCGVLRLVRFSLMAQKSKGDPDQIIADKKNFTGMPIPAGAAAVVSANLFLLSDEFRYIFTISNETRGWIMIAAMVSIGYFMISRWKFPSLKNLHIRVASFQVVFLTVMSAVLLFYGLLNHFALVFFVGSWGYLSVAMLLTAIRLISGRKSKTLEEFEPESDDLDLD